MENQRLTTGLPTKNFDENELLDQTIAGAASWLATKWHVAPQPLTRTLREMFGLPFGDASKAMAAAKRIHDQALAQREGHC